MNGKLPRLDKDQNNFIIEHLAAGTSMKAIVSEFLSMFPSFGSGSGFDDEEISDRIYQRIQKIKEKRINEIEALRDTDLSGEEAPYLSAQWRARRLHSLLLNVENKDPKIIQLQIKLIREIRAEAILLSKKNDEDKVDSPPLRDLVSEFKLDPKKFINSEMFGRPGITRLSDGVEFDANGRSYLTYRDPNSENVSFLSQKVATVWDKYDTNDPRFGEDEISDDDTPVENQPDAVNTNTTTDPPEATADNSKQPDTTDPLEPDNSDNETTETDTTDSQTSRNEKKSNIEPVRELDFSDLPKIKYTNS